MTRRNGTYWQPEEDWIDATASGTTGYVVPGDAVERLKALPDRSFQCCITSPPYWGLRDYGIDGQIGAEAKLSDYIDKLVTLFREVRRVLTDDGTMWLNVGDGYTSGGRTWRDKDKKNQGRAMSYRPDTPEGLKPKDLLGVPWRLALALQDDGWYLRADIVWHKPNGQPESVKDRPTRIHEYIFLLTKAERYFYDYEAVREPALTGGKKGLRSVWNLNTEPLKEAHFATFPTSLVRQCMKAGSSEESWVLDPFFGSGTVGVVAAELRRKFVGVELNASYVEIARKRLGIGVDGPAPQKRQRLFA